MSHTTTTARDNDANLRLRRARMNAGFATAADFARHYGIKTTSYQHHENGHRDLTPDRAKLYAKFLKLPPGELLYGEQLRSLVDIPIVGSISSTGYIKAMSQTLEYDPPTAVLPDLTQLVGHRIEGNDLYPAYRDGDIVFHQKLIPGRFDLQDLHGLECVVETQAGDRMLRQVVGQPDGRATLIAYHAPPLLNQSLVAAAPIVIVKRNVPGVFKHR